MTEHSWSIRWRLARATLAVVGLGWLGTILLTLWLLDYEMNESLDQEMALVARTTLLGIESTPGPVVPRIVGMSPGQDEEDERLVRLSLPGAILPPAPWPQPAEDGFSEANGWRILRATGDQTVIEVAQSRAWRREEMFEAASALIVLVLPMILLLAWGITRGLTRTLAPIAALADAIGARRPDDLSPVTGTGIPRELQPLTKGLNLYLGRIDDLRQAERRFVANAAHELRTPIATIRARLDLEGDPAGAVPMLDDLSRRVERLLQLARSEAGLGLGGGPVDLLRVLRLLVADASRREGVTIHFDDGDMENLILPFDPDAVAILLRNLIDNAVDHGDGRVRLTLTPGARLTIENPTTESTFAEAPFSKGPQSGGVGLGLSIVAALAATMGIGVEKHIEGDRARVVVAFR
ncbi:MAG: hypothetical protein LBE86_01195 [Gemmobacter sp.]|jgi:two-component system OmpR family sensor kinase|nr:hypothetical protein [Gemmobacter sp.]